jgi:hypothetical protein
LEEQRHKFLQLGAQLRQEREKNAELTLSNSKLVETVKDLETRHMRQVLSAKNLERERERKDFTAMYNRMLAINALHHQAAEEYHQLYLRYEKRKLQSENLEQNIIKLKEAKTRAIELLVTNCEGYNNAANCSICFMNKITHSITPCGHSYCESCVVIWFRQPQASCLDCRGSVTGLIKVHSIIVDKDFEIEL